MKEYKSYSLKLAQVGRLKSSGRLSTKDHRISVPLLQLKEDLAHLHRMVDITQLVNSRDKSSRLGRKHAVDRNQRLDGQRLLQSRNGVASTMI